MNKIFAPLFAIALMYSCNISPKEIEEHSSKAPDKDTLLLDTISPMITGVGGIFFYSENPQKMQDWYKNNLGLKLNDWGSASFDTRSINNPNKMAEMQWSLFKKESDYFAPSKKEFMINYTVQNIEGLVDQIQKNGGTLLDSVQSYDYGKFVHLMDNEENKIELWEP